MTRTLLPLLWIGCAAPVDGPATRPSPEAGTQPGTTAPEVREVACEETVFSDPLTRLDPRIAGCTREGILNSASPYYGDSDRDLATVSHDACGREASVGGTSYGWAWVGELQVGYRGGAVVWQAGFDALGRQVERRVFDEGELACVVTYAYVGDTELVARRIEDCAEDQNVSDSDRTYTWEDGLLVAEEVFSTVLTHSYDAEGRRIRTEIDAPSSLVDLIEYDHGPDGVVEERRIEQFDGAVDRRISTTWESGRPVRIVEVDEPYQDYPKETVYTWSCP